MCAYYDCSVFRLFLLLATVGIASAYQHYQDEIPNGNRVPDPKSGGTWQGVGHENAQGGGPRNPFGLDFAANGHVSHENSCLHISQVNTAAKNHVSQAYFITAV